MLTLIPYVLRNAINPQYRLIVTFVIGFITASIYVTIKLSG